MKNLNEIEEALRKVGRITEAARLSGKSLGTSERRFILEVRREARQRYSQQMINAIEREGEGTVRS